MKTTSKILCVCLLLSFTLSVSAQKKNADAEAIRAVIERETKAFFEIDYKTWADSWAHTAYAFWSFADTTDVNSFSGWTQIEKGFAEYFRTSKPSTAKIQREWLGLEVKIYGNGAYVRFNQIVNDGTVRPGQAEVRVLEKINGQWKIVCVSVIALEKENQPQR
jgi:ketosteroid isomerase-like protein